MSRVSSAIIEYHPAFEYLQAVVEEAEKPLVGSIHLQWLGIDIFHQTTILIMVGYLRIYISVADRGCFPLQYGLI